MRFFCSATPVDYPDTAAGLKLAIMQHAIHGPQKIPMAYFDNYFSKDDANIVHDLLGNLSLLADEIDACYGSSRGLNLVSMNIRVSLQKLEASQQQAAQDGLFVGNSSW